LPHIKSDGELSLSDPILPDSAALPPEEPSFYSNSAEKDKTDSHLSPAHIICTQIYQKCLAANHHKPKPLPLDYRIKAGPIEGSKYERHTASLMLALSTDTDTSKILENLSTQEKESLTTQMTNVCAFIEKMKEKGELKPGKYKRGSHPDPQIPGKTTFLDFGVTVGKDESVYISLPSKASPASPTSPVIGKKLGAGFSKVAKTILNYNSATVDAKTVEKKVNSDEVKRYEILHNLEGGERYKKFFKTHASYPSSHTKQIMVFKKAIGRMNTVFHGLSSEEKQQAILGLMENFSWLQEQGICHGDLKEDQILLHRNEQGEIEVVIIDLGASIKRTADGKLDPDWPHSDTTGAFQAPEHNPIFPSEVSESKVSLASEKFTFALMLLRIYGQKPNPTRNQIPAQRFGRSFSNYSSFIGRLGIPYETFSYLVECQHILKKEAHELSNQEEEMRMQILEDQLEENPGNLSSEERQEILQQIKNQVDQELENVSLAIDECNSHIYEDRNDMGSLFDNFAYEAKKDPFLNIIKDLLRKDPNARPDMSTVIEQFKTLMQANANLEL
jgi:serine/threonine protein kinase